VGLSNVDNVQQYTNTNPSGFETPTELDARDTANRDRSNHTGTQTAATISNFDAEVSNNTDVVANTAKVSADGSVTTHSDVTDAGSGEIITDAERTKLSGIEAGAKDDQNASEVPVSPAVNGQTNVQASLEDHESRLDTLETVDHVPVTLNADDTTQETLNLTGQELQVNQASTTTDGAMSSEDKTKLDGIENNATSDQSASEVPFTPNGDIAATDVQNAVQEVRDDTDTKLSGKANTIHTHVKSDITDFNEADYATAAQGLLADSAVQPGDLGTVATTNDYNDLDNLPVIPGPAPVDSVNGEVGTVVLDADDIDDSVTTNKFATQAQLNQISTNQTDITGKADVVHTHVKADITDFNDADYATAAQGALADSALQTGDNVSELVNDAGYLTTFSETDPVFTASEAANFVAGDKANLDNQSGINTGDETTSSIQTKRPLKTVAGQSLEGSGNVDKFLNPTLVLSCTGVVDLNTGAGVTVPFTVVLRSTLPGISVSGAGVVTLGTAGQYRVSYKINGDNQTNGRKNVGVAIRKNGVQLLPLTASYSYIRNVTDRLITNTIPLTDDIINMNLIGGETFEVFAFQIGSGGVVDSIPAECVFTIEQIA